MVGIGYGRHFAPIDPQIKAIKGDRVYDRNRSNSAAAHVLLMAIFTRAALRAVSMADSLECRALR